MNKLEKNLYRYIYGGCIGIYYVMQIIIGLVIIALSIIIQRLIEKLFLQYEKLIQVVSGVILYPVFLIAVHFIAYLPPYIHEIGHVLAALSFKADVAGIILSPFEGQTYFNGENLLDSQLTIIAASGVLGILTYGSFLLFLFYRDDTFTFKLYFPISLVI